MGLLGGTKEPSSKLTSARMWAKEAEGESRRTRTESGYKAYLRASLPTKAKPEP